MDKLEKFLNKFLAPVAMFMNKSKFFSTLAEAFMQITPITLGAAVLMIVGNFPVPGWKEHLEKIGLYAHFTAVQGATLNALSIFVAFNFAYIYAKKSEYNPLPAGLLSVASFFIVMPQILIINGNPIEAFQTTYTGGTGLLVAILVAYITSLLYVFFNRKNIVVKLPDSVPTNVTESLRPSILSGLIFIIFFLIRLAFAYIPFLRGDIFTFISSLIQAPLQQLTANAGALIIIFTLANLLWFFGIHPNMIYGVVTPLFLANGLANQEAYAQNKALPFLLFSIISLVIGNGFGGQGSTYGLVIAMIRSKSQRYKELFKLCVVPSIFNINEPLVFGMPIMMNPLFFFPMVLSPALMGGTAILAYKLIDLSKFNPFIIMPWTTPSIIKMFLCGGVKLFLVGLVIIVVNYFLWLPFFKIADDREVKEEKGIAA
ncbi:MAG: PTS transporter subunit EIIC [Lactobacillales bacterium]|jgi:PTS system cellobiose-specific IIC component|nr:PTS transporter subunit EIIC [Lactobacillales bacterium]